MITNESLLFAKYFFSWSKIRKNVFKLNRLVGLIFGNIKFWRPIRAEARQNLTEYQMDLKMVSKRPQRILMNLQLIFESVLLAIFVTNSDNVIVGGPMCPPPLSRVKLLAIESESCTSISFLTSRFHHYISNKVDPPK